MAKKPKTPLGGWPGGANPKTVNDINTNLKEARARLEQCLAEKSTHWKWCHEHAMEGFIQLMVFHREEAEKWGTFAVKLEAMIEQWERRKYELSIKPEKIASPDPNLARIYLGRDR